MMVGTDIHGRKFIATNLEILVDQDVIGEVVGTFFERYSDSQIAIAYGTSAWYLEHNAKQNSSLLYNDSRVRGDDLQVIAKSLRYLSSGNPVYNNDDG
jgi:hypothetical protein